MKTVISKRKGPVLWAIDPFEVERLKAQENILPAIRDFEEASSVLQPVYIWDLRSRGAANSMELIREQADLILSKWPKAVSGIRLLPVQVIAAPGGTADRVKALVDYARKRKSPLIVVSHHTRKVLERWIQGSFCENLSLVSDIPLLVVPPEWKPKELRSKILFPTDLSPISLGVFESVLEMARRTNRRIVIYHKVDYPMFFGTEAGASLTKEMMESDREFLASARAQVRDLKAQALAGGVPCDMIVNDRRVGHIGLAIVAEAKRGGYAWVAMAAHGGFFTRLFVGSTTRFVLRECRTPMWVLRPGSTHEAKRKKPARQKPIGEKWTEPNFMEERRI